MWLTCDNVILKHHLHTIYCNNINNNKKNLRKLIKQNEQENNERTKWLV